MSNFANIFDAIKQKSKLSIEDVDEFFVLMAISGLSILPRRPALNVNDKED